jgi:hypothetical protein
MNGTSSIKKEQQGLPINANGKYSIKDLTVVSITVHLSGLGKIYLSTLEIFLLQMILIKI